MDDGFDAGLEIDYHPDEGVYRARHEGPGELATTVLLVVEAVVDPEDSDRGPYRYGIDLDALDALFRPMADGEDRATAIVEFVVEDHVVAVSGDGVIEIRPPADG